MQEQYASQLEQVNQRLATIESLLEGFFDDLSLSGFRQSASEAVCRLGLAATVAHQAITGYDEEAEMAAIDAARNT